MSKETKNTIKQAINIIVFVASLINIYINIQQQEFVWVIFDTLSALLFGHLSFNKNISWLDWF